jgi:hypothetical protein
MFAPLLVALLPVATQVGKVTNYVMEATAARNATQIASYDIVKTAHPGGNVEYEVTLLGTGNENQGTALIKEMTVSGIQVVTVSEPGRGAVTVTFDRSKETMTLTVGRRTGAAKLDRTAPRWMPDARFTRLLAEHRPTVELSGALLADIVDQPKMEEKKKELGPECSAAGPGNQPFVSDQLITSAIACNGPYCRGTDVAPSRSYCCYEARLAAGSCCWNSLCIGCCQYLSNWGSCDAWCAVGDYFCFCGVTGISCSAN